jgi:hypothetical protein
MKHIELSSGLRTVVSNEENLLLSKIAEAGGEIAKTTLSAREQVLARELVKKSVLTRRKQLDKLYYELDDPSSTWRL